MGKNIYIGILHSESRLRTETGEILLTALPPQAAQLPESSRLEIAPGDVGKMAVVKGTLSGRVLYSAEIVEVFSPATAAIFNTLLQKDILSAEEITRTLETLESERTGSGKLCALVIGHKKDKPGASNSAQSITEFDFNEELALLIEKKVSNEKIQRVYRRTYQELPGDINALDPDFVISLHCNAYNTEVSGTEVLYYRNSAKGKMIAEILLAHLVGHLGLPNRGTQPKSTEDRGGYLLRYTSAPCVIAEPFFIDNGRDLVKARDDMEGLAEAYAKAIEEIAPLI